MSTNLPAMAHDGHRLSWPRAAASADASGTGGSLTYEPFYGLAQKPFSLASDPRFLYKSPAHAPAFDRLLAGIRRREGLIVLSGDIGTGKTTLCRAVLERLDRRTFSTFVPDPFVSREDLLKMLLVDFGVMSVDDLKGGRLRHATRSELSYPLYEFLNSLVPLQAFAVLVIDEAQNLPPTLLEEIRILSDLEGREKLLQVVLVGQPELRANLKLPEMRQVDQRVSVRCELSPLEATEVAAYVTWRLNVAAGGQCDTVRFTADAIDAIYQASGGVPRMINRVCDGALQRGFNSGARVIEADHVVNALTDLGIDDVSAAVNGPRPTPPAVAPSAAEAPQLPAPSDAAMDLVRARELAATSGPVAEFASEAEPRAASNIGAAWGRFAGLRSLLMLALAGGAVGATAIAAGAGFSLPAGNVGPIAAPQPPARPSLARGAAYTAPAAADHAAVPRASGSADAARYIIQVASFEDERRATRLVQELSAAGYRAYHSSFDLDGEGWWEVSVGPYAALAAVQADLARIRALSDYEDATLRALARP